MKYIEDKNIKNKSRFTVKDFIDFVKKFDLPEDTPILVERVEDLYFEDLNWSLWRTVGKDTGYHLNGDIIDNTLDEYMFPEGCGYHKKGKVVTINMHY